MLGTRLCLGLRRASVEGSEPLTRTVLSSLWEPLKDTSRGKVVDLIGELLSVSVDPVFFAIGDSDADVQFITGLFCAGSHAPPSVFVVLCLAASEE